MRLPRSSCGCGRNSRTRRRARRLPACPADLLGAPLQYQDEEIARITSPRHFVEVRRTPGGPAPAETTRAIALSRDVLGRDRAWLDKTHEALRDADARRRQRSQML